MKARAATEAELDAIHRLECELFPRPWSLAELKAGLAGHHCLRVECALLEDSNEVVGYSIWRSISPELELLRVATAKAHRGRGFARCLLQAALERARVADFETALLEVAARNASALRLYTGLGFVEVGRRRDYYPAAVPGDAPDDAVLMNLRL